MTRENKKFNFFIPAAFEKGFDSNGNPITKVSGVCSTTDRDLDKHILHPAGFDFRPLLNTGFINYNHRSKDNPSAIIGEPTLGRVQNNDTEFYIEGYLYEDSKKAKEVIELNDTLMKSSQTRRLGWSIEGYAIETHPTDPSIITRAVITGVAITANPKNPKTLVSILKGEGAEPDDEDENELDTMYEFNAENLDKTKKNPKDIEKMDSGSMPIIESVDGGHKKTHDVDRMRKLGIYPSIENVVLTKSYVFDKIFERFPELTEEVYEKVYNFITLNEKQMDNATILKSLDELQGKGLQIENENAAFEKGMSLSNMKGHDDDKHDDNDEDDDDDEPTEEDEKNAMIDIAKSCYGDGMDGHEMVENLVKIGFRLQPSMDTVEQVLREYGTDANGSDHEAVSAPIVKSLDASEFAFEVSESLDGKFKAIGNLMKHQIDSSNTSQESVKQLVELVKSQQSEFLLMKEEYAKTSASLSKVEAELESLSTTPNARKSLIKGDLPGFKARFDEEAATPSNGNIRTFSFNKADSTQVNKLLDLAFNKSEELTKSGHPSHALNTGIQEIEMAGMIVSPEAKQAVRQHLEIQILD